MAKNRIQGGRQILADLDSVGNTTKAETKGSPLRSAVIAAVSLFASFIAVMAMGSEEKISEMTTTQYHNVAGMLTVANPVVCLSGCSLVARCRVSVQLDDDPARSGRAHF